MSISVMSDGRAFHLATKNTSYVIGANKVNRLQNFYYGARVNDAFAVTQRDWNPQPASFSARQPGDYVSPDVLPQEYSGFNNGDMRMAALIIKTNDGARWTDPRFKGYEISKGKRPLHGLPQSFAKIGEEIDQLVITLEDAATGVEVLLLYTVYEECDVIARSAVIRNISGQSFMLERAMSLNLDLTGKENYDFVNYFGSWSRERHMERTALRHGIQETGSLRGATGHVHSPAMILCSPDASETAGEAFGFVLAYSGNHLESAELDHFDGLRVQLGINPQLFSWKLDAGAEFETPEAFMTRSGEGFGLMSRNLHDFMRAHLIRSPWNGRQRPILVNNWEGTFFDFTAEKIIAIAEAAAKLNIEMLVLDDGWFGHRDDDTTSLGDWFEYSSKVGDMADLAGAIHKLGMKFGLWFEPEMISEDSELYRAHPDWAMCIPGRQRAYGRNQLILDYSRPEVVQHLFDMMSGLIRRAKIDYIKWDMNRNMTDVFSIALPADQQGEVAHRYILGVYDLHDRLIKEFPNLLIEGCSGGGGRFDAGMLYYLPQVWCSDNTNAMDRLAIQAGTSLIYPVAAMGAHINAEHSPVTGEFSPLRHIPFITRGNVAMAGTFGYELDLTKMTEDERKTALYLNAAYKRYHDTISEGDYYRLTDVFKENEVEAWSCVAKDKKQAVLTVVRRTKVGFIGRCKRFRVPGLDPKKTYRMYVNNLEKPFEVTYPGDVLSQCGIWCTEVGFNDCQSAVYLFEAID